MKQIMSWLIVGSICGVLLFSGVPVRADNACEGAIEGTESIAAALSTSLTGTTDGGEFRVKHTEENTAKERFEIQYLVNKKVVATHTIQLDPVPKDSLADFGNWFGGWADLKITAEKNQLKLRWNSGGSHCCTCSYTITPLIKGFRALIINQ